MMCSGSNMLSIYDGIFIKDPYTLEKRFFKNLKEQFAKLIILDCKCPSGYFTKIENIFFERKMVMLSVG